MEHRKNKGILFVNMAVLFFGMAGLFAKWISLPSLGITFGRVVFSSITLGVWMLFRKESFRIHDRKDGLLLAVAGAILALHWWTFLGSIQLSTVAIGTLTFSAFPLFVTFLEPLVFGKKLHIRDVLTACLILLGVIITIPEISLANHMFRGIVAGMISSLAYATLAVMNKRFTERYSGTQIAFYEQGTAAVVLVPFALRAGLHPSVKDMALLLFLGVFMTALAHTLFIASLKQIPAQLAGICSSMETVYGILLALILLGEVPSVRECIGAVLIVGTVVIAQIRSGKADAENQ